MVEKKRHRHVKLPWGKSKTHELTKSNEAPGQPKLEPLASVPGGRSQPSILDSPAVHGEVERQRSEAAEKQSSTSFLHRLSWAQSHKTELTELCGALRQCNNELESLFLPTRSKTFPLLLPANELTVKLSSTVDSVEKALGKLHEALAKLNAPADTFRHSDQKNRHLSLQLQEDPEVNRKQLRHEPEVHLRDDSYVFNIQRQEDADPQSKADLLFVETLKDPDPKLDNIPNTGSPLPELHDLMLPPIRGVGVETLGFFRAPSSKYNIHVLFRDNSKQLYSPLHLANIISSSDYRDHMSPTQLVQLVRLVMTSHLYLSSVRDSLDVNPRLTHFRYFCRAGEKATGWDFEKPLVLRPWLSFGFGSSPRRYNLGEEQGVQTISSPSLIELGLVLYQICVGEVMNYAGDSSVARAKSTALKGLNRIDKAVGSTVTEIVQMLLSPASLAKTGDKIGENEEREYILNAITTLITYEERIEDTVAKWEKEAPSPNLAKPARSKGPTAQAVGGASDNDRRSFR